MALLVAGAMASINRDTIEAARNLGASRLRMLFEIVVPQVSVTLTVGLILSFVTMMSVLSVPLMINAQSPTMLTADIAFRVNAYGDYGVANALGLVSLVLASIGRMDLSPPEPQGARMTAATATASQSNPLAALWWIPRAIIFGLLAFFIFGPLANLLLWTVAEKWYFPHSLPLEYGFSSWTRVFAPRGGAVESLTNSLIVAVLTVVVSLLLAIPAGYALARLKLPFRALILLAFLIPQAFPNLTVYVNVARIFYEIRLNGTIIGVVLVHASHGLVYAVWIATAAFSAIDEELEQAARSSGAGAFRAFMDITLPLAAPGLMASAIFVFLESLDEFTGSYFVGAPDVNMLPLLLYTAGAGGNYQIASITALLLLVPSLVFMLIVERFLKADVLSRVGH